jgi:hypothetical protein
MTEFTNFLEENLLDYTFRSVAFTQPTTLYIGLSTTTILDDGSGISEPAGNGYARVQFDAGTTNYGRTGNVVSNNSDITFPAASGASWGNITDVFISNAASAGDILCYTSITSKTINDGDVAKISTGNLTITLN